MHERLQNPDLILNTKLNLNSSTKVVDANGTTYTMQQVSNNDPKVNHVTIKGSLIKKMNENEVHCFEDWYVEMGQNDALHLKGLGTPKIDQNGVFASGQTIDMMILGGNGMYHGTVGSAILKTGTDGKRELLCWLDKPQVQPQSPAKSRFGLGAHLITIVGIGALGVAGYMYVKNVNNEHSEKK
jgi:hypothetical protein